MEADKDNMAETEVLLAEFILEMHKINKHADKLEQAYLSVQKRYEEITKRSESLLLEFDQTAKNNEALLAEMQRYTNAVTSQVTRMESSLKSVAAIDAFLKTLDVPKTAEHMTSVIKNDMNELTDRFENLIEEHLREMLLKLISELNGRHNVPTAPQIVLPPTPQTMSEWKSIIELFKEVSSFPFLVRKNSWRGDYCLRVDNIVNGKAIGMAFKNGQEHQQKNDVDALNDRKYKLHTSSDYNLNADELPF